MSTLHATRMISIFVFCLLGVSILVDSLNEAEDAVASPFIGMILLGSSLVIFFLPRILS